ncbi:MULTISPECIES: EAL domain-containing protein [unclassified Bradyrhizobium]|uniref:bifunctional diguanylate cyclase/phosphodiesterase n=1 Tax=unclassified Bradyrhizobium TaxID=2631580 RepID=UPI0028EC8AB9|nr:MULTISPECIES: EAL domain-containing protein [unclassified Bradyrhizobium]
MPPGLDLSGPIAAKPAPSELPRQRDPVRWLIACGCLLIGAIIVGTLVMADGFRSRALDNGGRELENTALLLTRHFEQQFNDAETVARDLIDRMHLSDIATSDTFRAQMSGGAIRELLQSEGNGLSYMGDLTIVDADGHIINWSGPTPAPSINLAERNYFKTLKTNPSPDQVVIETIRSYVTGRWSVLVAHRLSGKDGVFLGLLSRRINPETYETYLQSMALDRGTAITLLDGDGTLLVRHPRADDLVGHKITDVKLLAPVLEQGRHRARMRSPIDNIERIGAGARIADLPLVVVATRHVDDVLADWRSQAVLLAAAAALTACVIAAMFALIIRQIARQNGDAKRRLEQEKQRVDTALNNMTQGLVLYDAKARVAMFNQRFLDLLGLDDHEELSGCHFRDLVERVRHRGLLDVDVDQFCTRVMDNVAAGVTTQAVLETTSGRFYHVIDKPLAHGGWVTTIEDISEHRRLEQERDRDRSFLRKIIDHIPSQITVKDVRDRRYLLVNRVAERHFLRARDSIIGKTVFELFPESAAEQVTVDDDRAIASPDGLFLDEHPTESLALGLRYVTSYRIAIHDAADAPRYLIHMVEDVTERRQADEKIAHLAHYDALTDLPNRVLFAERIEQALERARNGEPFALVYIDVDEFKGINDSLGHHVGDELLKTVAERINSCVAPGDLVARLGGDEFALLLTSVKDRDDVLDVVSRIFGAIRRPAHCLGHQLSIDASIGIALAPQDGTERDQLIKNADLAMYAAKAGGRRTSRFFEPAMDESARARLRLEQDLRRALAENQFELHYQPLVDLRDNRMTGCEALLRWRHPQRGMIPPLDFIPLAEDTGLIDEIGDWVLRTATAEAATWPADIRIAVNVSPVQLKSQSLALRVAGALAASGLAPQRLEIEITEAVLIRDDETALNILHQLHEIGVRIALDDFGTGYSSLSYLKRFPFDKIKIDRCFVSDLEVGGSSAIVQAVVGIAAASNMTTTAEGVETGQQQALLRQLGCTEMQGYLFSAPKPASELRNLFVPAGSARAAG